MNAQDLAKSMNVSVTDVMALAQSVANSMIKDGLSAEHANTDTVTAYIPHAVKKFEQFQSKYLTNPEARTAFCVSTFNDIKASL